MPKWIEHAADLGFLTLFSVVVLSMFAWCVRKLVPTVIRVLEEHIRLIQTLRETLETLSESIEALEARHVELISSIKKSA